MAEAGGFADVSVEEMTGVMRFDSLDEHWAYMAAVAGPVVELVASLDPAQIDAIRGTLGPSLAPYQRDGAFEIRGQRWSRGRRKGPRFPAVRMAA